MMEEADDGGRWDFLDRVGPDTSSCIFKLLDHPADLARAAAVSRSWRRFVIDNEFCKRLCRQLCPEVANFTSVAVVTRRPEAAAAAPGEPSRDADLRARETDHAVYCRLGGALVSAKTSTEDCILNCVAASSTDNFPQETVDNTLEPEERVYGHSSYWSSAGQDDPDVPESLIYRLSSDLCLVDEIRIRPFRAYFQPDNPIYSSRAVRIRMGHSMLPPGTESFVSDENENLKAMADENYTWTYTSPEFPENVLQTFKLPRPALCIGGIVKFELLGRIQKQATDDRYYICICHAQVMGRPLSSDLMVNISNPADYSILKYLPGASNVTGEDILNNDGSDSTEWHSLVSRYWQMRHLAGTMRNHMLGPEQRNLLLGPVQFVDEDDYMNIEEYMNIHMDGFMDM
ncbi:hypothetical protein U9M48_005876 [Paspalum notatum var. saurae]|uniref:F-box domain-containing protein n=1 Tax=Paspalum notatum var. saurae TaxID=547442 RepID=A0AAQ3PYH1_PASNO